MVNVARAGLNYLHTTRVSPAANDLSDIPAQFGIQGIPQVHENGGLPEFRTSMDCKLWAATASCRRMKSLLLSS